MKRGEQEGFSFFYYVSSIYICILSCKCLLCCLPLFLLRSSIVACLSCCFPSFHYLPIKLPPFLCCLPPSFHYLPLKVVFLPQLSSFAASFSIGCCLLSPNYCFFLGCSISSFSIYFVSLYVSSYSNLPLFTASILPSSPSLTHSLTHSPFWPGFDTLRCSPYV